MPSSVYPAVKPTNPTTRINFVVNKDYFNPKTYYNYENILNYEDYYEYDKSDKPELTDIEDNDLEADKNRDKQIRDNLKVVTSNKNSCAVLRVPTIFLVTELFLVWKYQMVL